MAANHPFWNQPLVRQALRPTGGAAEESVKVRQDLTPLAGAPAFARPEAAAAPVIPAYRVHRGKGLGYVRLSGRVIYLGKAQTPESVQRYRQVVGEWLATGRPPQRSRTHGTDAALTVGMRLFVELVMRFEQRA